MLPLYLRKEDLVRVSLLTLELYESRNITLVCLRML